VGGVLGGSLLRSGWDVTFLARGSNLENLRKNGLIIQWPSEKWEFASVKTLHQDDPKQSFDFLLFCVKGYDWQSALPLLKQFPSRYVLAFQNGVSIHHEMQKRLGDSVSGSVIYIAAEQVEPAHIVSRSSARVVLDGGPDRPKEEINSLRDALANPNLIALISENIELDLWRKYLFLCAFSAINTLSEKSLGPILQEPASRNLFQSLMKEIVHAGNAAGVPLNDADVETTLGNASKFPAETSSSLFADYRRGKQTEVELLQGHLVRLGDEYHLNLPVSRTVYALLKLKTAPV
jgi:2-dehydropantoate 2-reductase